jgi:hypothetical protein
MSETKLMTYAEYADAIGRSLAAGRAICLRKRWKRIIGNDGLARVAVPLDALAKPPRKHALPEAPPAPLPEAVSEGLPAPLPDASADARALIALLEERIAELQDRVSELDSEVKEGRAELRQAHATISDLTVKAARTEALELILAAQTETTDNLRAERDRWAEMAEAAQHQAEQAQCLLADMRAQAERGFLARLARLVRRTG